MSIHFWVRSRMNYMHSRWEHWTSALPWCDNPCMFSSSHHYMFMNLNLESLVIKLNSTRYSYICVYWRAMFSGKWLCIVLNLSFISWCNSVITSGSFLRFDVVRSICVHCCVSSNSYFTFWWCHYWLHWHWRVPIIITLSKHWGVSLRLNLIRLLLSPRLKLSSWGFQRWAPIIISLRFHFMLLR